MPNRSGTVGRLPPVVVSAAAVATVLRSTAPLLLVARCLELTATRAACCCLRCCSRWIDFPKCRSSQQWYQSPKRLQLSSALVDRRPELSGNSRFQHSRFTEFMDLAQGSIL
ncbi:hypothetical protein M9H77_30907 [Catharanthus roseus]|uniref:Uncharacterized protein n=1 Tax=Catharanthus roseus TaxID=4058 RepID=A0ACC0A0F7_CATRO|nr:hypothetical protein M9H77_30907 [Catharanthus roseus]